MACRITVVLPAAHGAYEPGIPSIRPGVLQRDHCPDGGRDPTDQGDLEDEANDARQYPAPEDEGQEGKENGDEGHVRFVFTLEK